MRCFTRLLSVPVPMRERKETEAVIRHVTGLLVAAVSSGMWAGMYTLATPQACIGALNEEVRQRRRTTSS